jgi:hypothetical protein
MSAQSLLTVLGSFNHFYQQIFQVFYLVFKVLNVARCMDKQGSKQKTGSLWKLGISAN